MPLRWRRPDQTSSTSCRASTLTRLASRLWDGLTSLKLTIVCLALLMILVVACTLPQVCMGTLGAVNAYIRSFLICGRTDSGCWIPVAPGDGLRWFSLLV